MRSLIIAALMCASVSPALAQQRMIDQFEGNDWWVVQPGDAESAIVISSQNPTRHEDRASLWLVVVYQKPRKDGVTGYAASMIVNCTTRTTSTLEPCILDSNGDLKGNQSVVLQSVPLDVTSSLYRFGCVANQKFTRIRNADRRAAIAELLVSKPEK